MSPRSSLTAPGVLCEPRGPDQSGLRIKSGVAGLAGLILLIAIAPGAYEGLPAGLTVKADGAAHQRS